MKIRDGFILRAVADTNIVVATGKENKNFNKVVKLNESAAFLWNQLYDDRSSCDLENALISEYGISRERAAADVSSFVSKLKGVGILD